MTAGVHTQSGTLVERRDAWRSPTRTVALTIAAVLAGAFLIGVTLVSSLLLAGPWPTYDGGSWPQLVPQPSAAAGLDA